MSESRLLVDCAGYAQLSLNESKTNGKTYFRGKFQEANKVNKNKREYRFAALDENVTRLQESIKGNRLYGECDHASDSIVHLANASHLITKLWWEGYNLMGEAMVLPTPSGRVLKAIIESGGIVGISSRGVGNGTNNADGVLVIDAPNFQLITWDVVADPSTYGAHMSPFIPKESFEQTLVSGSTEIYETVKPKINYAEAIDGMSKIIAENYLRNLRNKK